MWGSTARTAAIVPGAESMSATLPPGSAADSASRATAVPGWEIGAETTCLL